MKTRIAILIFICALGTGCRKHVEPQYIAGYIAAISDTEIRLDVPDSIPSERVFVIDDNTTYDESTFYEGNIAEVMYLPADTESEQPIATNIISDPTYPHMLGRWHTDKDDKLQIDIVLQSHGKILQIAPTEVLQFSNWQLTGIEDQITLHGTLALPQAQEQEKTKSKDDNNELATSPTRHTMHFSATAKLSYDEEGNTEQHKVLIVTTDKGRKSKLYPAGQENY